MTLDVLIALLAKSSLIAGVGLLLTRFATRRPVERVDILRGTVLMLLALPVLMAVGPALSLAVLPSAPAAAPTAPPVWSGQVEPLDGVAVSGALARQERQAQACQRGQTACSRLAERPEESGINGLLPVHR